MFSLTLLIEVLPETSTAVRVPTEVRDEVVIPDPRVVEDSARDPPILNSLPAVRFR